MTKQTDWLDYEARLQRVISHIHDHIEEDIDLDQFATVACLSSFFEDYLNMLQDTAPNVLLTDIHMSLC